MTYVSNIVRREGDPRVLRSGPSSLTSSDRLGKALGWFSLGLGLVELLAPHRITQALGMQGQEALVRAYGAREISSGMLSLSTEKSLGLWSRIGGDGIDIATLLTAYRDDNPKKQNVAAALAMVAGITLLDMMAAQGTTTGHSRNGSSGDRNLYRGRSGFPGGLEKARGAAKEFQAPADMRSGRTAGRSERAHEAERVH
jgi:hypothetical protein